MENERFLDKTNPPSQSDISTALRDSEVFWLDILKHIESNYDYYPELIFFTKKYGWSIRYRKNKKTLCYLFLENNSRRLWGML